MTCVYVGYKIGCMSEEIRINVRTKAQIKKDLEVTARLKGLSVSALVNYLVVNAIREEKQVAPEAFENASTHIPNENEIDAMSLNSDRVNIPAWQKGFRKAKGMWKERTDLPDLRDLRKEADRGARWDRD